MNTTKLSVSILSKISKALFIIILALPLNGFSQSVIYVKHDAGGSGDGSSWTDAYTTLYSALTNASAEDTIWVAEGTYYPNDVLNRYSTLQMVKEVAIYGGFDGTETNLNQRDYENNISILSGDIGVIDDATDNAYHVVTGIDTARIDGFTIQKGYADGGGYTISSGGGIFIYTFEGLESLEVSNCKFNNNKAKAYGGAIHLYNAQEVIISNCTFENNTIVPSQDLAGGAIGTYDSKLEITNCIFTDNNSRLNGGAIYNNHSNVSIKNSIFTSNSSSNGNGGAIANYMCSPTISNSIFISNQSSGSGYGGAIYNQTIATIINCTFKSNVGGINGGAIADNDWVSHIANCIFYANFCSGQNKSVHNVIGTNSPDVTYSRTDEIVAGTGNIRLNPMFVNDGNDWHLQAGSPCIDAANGNDAPANDKDGNSRHDDFGVNNSGTGTPAYTDMGAYEFQGNSPLNGTYTIGTSGNFSTFTEAIDSLISLGVNAAAIFNVESGTYTEHISIPEIIGASATNTIIFQSASGDSTDVVLSYAATAEGDNYTLKLDGADYITFKNITLEAIGAEYARVVEIGNEANNNRFANNRLLGVPNKSELVYSPYSKDSSNVFTHNVFQDGKMGIYLSGGFANHLTIEHNEFLHQTDTAVYVQYFQFTEIKSNLIYSDNHITGILLYDNREYIALEQNEIYLPNGGIGLHIYACRLASDDTSAIFNNHIYINTTNADKGIYIRHFYLSKIKIYHNTIHIRGNNTSSACYDMEYGSESYYYNLYNNNFVNAAMGMVMGTNRCGGDYNNFYSNGAKLGYYEETLEGWQDAYNHDHNSVSVDPYFVEDTTYHILHPALDGAGTALIEVTEDLDGDIRDATNPDIGADEFTPSPVPFSGTYTIAGITPDYETINDAVEGLTINGINGAVIFDIATDTLTEQIRIPEIVGASATNTITFQSATGDSSDVLITYTPVNTARKYTLCLDGADYIVFKKLSITSGEEWGYAIELKSEATHNIFEANKIFLATQVASGYDYSLVYAKGSLDSNNVFIGNHFEKGSYGIYLEDCASGSQIKNNKFINMSHGGIYLRNLINPEITGNYINISGTGIQLRDISSANAEKGLIANNMILNLSGRGIYLYNSSNLSIVYNTVVNAGSNSLYCHGNNFDILNNIFVINEGSYAAVISDTTDCNIDYNLYYHPNATYAEMYYSTGNTTDLEQYGFDLHSISREPVFVSDTDLHTTDPWMNNWGTPIAEVTTDIDGEARDAVNPDVGADEFDGIMPFEGEYTIGATGDFESFTEAVDTIAPVGISGPVTFKVESGTYNEQFVIPAIPEVSETNTVTFTSVSGDSTDVILQFDATSSKNYTVKMDSCSFITFQNMTIKALNSTYAQVVEFVGGATDNIFSNNILEGNGTTSAVIHSDGKENNNNQITNNLIKDGNVGVQMYGESTEIRESGTQIIGNIFENQNTTAIALKWNSSSTITKNNITHPELLSGQWTGIYMTECSSGLIANNIIAFNTESMSAGIVLAGSSNQKVYNNSVNIFGTHENSRAFNQQEGGSNNDLKNNIFSNQAGGLVIYTTDVNSFTSDYNNYYSTGERFIYYEVSGTEFYWISDLATWQSDYSKDLNSYSVDPKFVSNTNLLPANIVLDGSCTALAEVTEDYNGIPRDPANPDIGAYEFSGCTNSGTYTIGLSGADYTTFEEAIESLQTCWVGSSIIFNVQSGTYNEQLIIPEIPGLSETNTITFQSASGDSTDVILTYTSTSADTNYTIKFDGADYIRFKNMTIKATGSDYANVIEISNGASNNQFYNNQFIGVNTTDALNADGVLVYSPNKSKADTNNIFSSNLFLSGSHGIYLQNDYLNQITNNRFEEQISNGMYLYTLDSAFISMNEVLNTSSDTTYCGVYFRGTKSIFSKNRININNDYLAKRTGLYFHSDTSSIVSNNFIHIKTSRYSGIGMLLYSCKAYFNSVNITGSNNAYSFAVKMVDSYGNYCVLKNNILANNAGGRAMCCGPYANTNVVSNYNNLYSNGEFLAIAATGNVVDIAAWRTATSLDANSISVNPNFGSDLNLYTQDPIINGGGIPLAEVTDDIDGDARDAVRPDIGADEFETVLYVLGDNINACAYDTVTVDAGYGYDTYSWSNDSITQFTDIDTTGVGLDSVKLVSTVTLGGQEYKDSLWVSFHKPVALTFDIDTCEDNYVQLKASGGVSYHWDPYVTNPDTCCVSVYLSSTTHDYVVTVYDSYGCYDTDTATVVPYSKPSQPLIQFSNDSLMSSVTGTGYDWFLNSTLEAYTTQAILPQESGDYQVIVYNGGCPSDSSDSYNYIVGIEDIAGNREITLYPNPTDGKLFMSFEKPFKDIRLSVINMEGQVVLSRLLKDIPKGFLTELDLGEVPSGLYFIKFTNKEISRTARIIVR